MTIEIIDCTSDSDLVAGGMVRFALAMACVAAGLPLPWRRAAWYRRERALS